MCAGLLAERLGREGHRFFARRHGTAHGYRLVFDKRSSIEAFVGYANIRQETGSCVEGTLNELDDAALALLDRIELVPSQYRRELIEVHDAATGEHVSAFAYLAQPDVIDETVRPRRDYIERLLRAADVLPPTYIRALVAVECCP
jgi:gamma-glutamylcyclotransferase (GGCT)/AIG2-like uncharacterized protein YtfP